MKTVLRLLAVLLVTLCSGLATVAQDRLRQVDQPAKFNYPNTPIDVVVNIAEKPMINRQAMSGPDWLTKISLDVTNTSSKDINWLVINLVIREAIAGVREATPETAGIVIPFDLRYSEPSLKVLRVGNRVSLKPPVSQVEYWLNHARQQGINEIERVGLDIMQVGFTDDTSWYRGIKSHKDPESGPMMIGGSEDSSSQGFATHLIADIRPGFFLNSGIEPESPEADPGGCVWLVFAVPTVRISCASNPDGCNLPDKCDRLADASTTSTTPPAGSTSFPYGVDEFISFRCEPRTVTPPEPPIPPNSCDGCEIRQYKNFRPGCPSLCANAVRMPTSNSVLQERPQVRRIPDGAVLLRHRRLP